MTKPFYTDGKQTIYNGDCLEIMKTFPDKSFDLVLTDPPFGIGNFVQQTGNKRGEKVEWNDVIPTKEYFDELKRVSKNQIIWGANFFNCFPEKGGAIVWKKFQPMPDFSKCEIASCTYHTKTELFEYRWAQNTPKVSEHPCERPVELYLWCLKTYTKDTDTVLDPFLGSGSSLVAAKQLNRNAIGIEISPEYCQIAKDRLAQDLLF